MAKDFSDIQACDEMWGSRLGPRLLAKPRSSYSEKIERLKSKFLALHPIPKPGLFYVICISLCLRMATWPKKAKRNKILPPGAATEELDELDLFLGADEAVEEINSADFESLWPACTCCEMFPA